MHLCLRCILQKFTVNPSDNERYSLQVLLLYVRAPAQRTNLQMVDGIWDDLLSGSCKKTFRWFKKTIWFTQRCRTPYTNTIDMVFHNHLRLLYPITYRNCGATSRTHLVNISLSKTLPIICTTSPAATRSPVYTVGNCTAFYQSQLLPKNKERIFSWILKPFTYPSTSFPAELSSSLKPYCSHCQLPFWLSHNQLQAPHILVRIR